MSRLLLLAPLALLTACAPMQFATDHDRKADFSAYKSYVWTSSIPEKQWERAVREDIMIRRVVEQVEQVLASRGYRKGTDGKADFMVSFTPLLTTRMQTTGYSHYGWNSMETRRIKEAGIQLDVLDGASRKVVWTGFAGGGFQGSLSPQEAEAKVAEAVQGLLSRFPPQAGQR